MAIRKAQPGDLDEIVSMVSELAAYEREPDAVQLTTHGLKSALFAEHPSVFCLIAQTNDPQPSVAGFALYFLNFSTWEGVHGFHLEDLFVRPGFRGGGYGGALLRELARMATDNGYARVEWTVLDWNQPAIDFYDRIGSRPMSDWITYRLSGAALDAYAGADA